MGAALPVVAALCGAVVGSLLTALLANVTTTRRETRKSRLDVLTALMRGRNDLFDEDVAQAINVIPILFHDQSKVRRAYQHFCAVPNGAPADVLKRYAELVLAIADSLGFQDLTSSDVDLGFYPVPPAEAPRSTSATNTRLATLPMDRSADSSSPSPSK